MRPIAALLVAAATLSAGQAAALSCLRPDPVRIYTQARDAEEAFRIAYGQLDLSAVSFPQMESYDVGAPETRDFPGIPFEGHAITKDGFTVPVSTPVTVRLSCLGPWCPTPPGPEPMMMALEQIGDDWRVDINACGGDAYGQPSKGQLERVVACHRDEGDCATE
ncbi:hypothetical protein RM543_04020 [Roseicyclus sp. F158]|uniref:Uncharacterized protein n=1 Tax=Tropicimonas omnivorans TaxID=3075590 RepID=A0ABU3DDQ8_9RHOB|nr:hypothetical protein [Roseicyclus sp. F158]MDT0681841.1 hypothetical protein [Roseicyclus sp. F158]